MSFRYATTGLREALKQEANLKIHIIVSFIVIAAAIFLKFTPLELAILILTVAMVLLLELINTTLEALTDIVSPEIREKARIVKDVAAAGVFLAALTSVAVGILLFLPKFFS